MISRSFMCPARYHGSRARVKRANLAGDAHGFHQNLADMCHLVE